MPQIKIEDTGELGLRPTELGADSFAASARRVNAAYNQVADSKNQTGAEIGSAVRDVGQVAVDYEDHQQIMAGAAHGTELFDALTQSKDQAIKAIDPNDPSYGQKVEIALKQWRAEKLDPALDQFLEGFTTENSQKFAEGVIDKTRDHMFQSSAADISNAAGIGVRNAVKTIQNTASNTAILDPSSVPAQLSLVEHSIGALVDSSPMKGIAGAQIKSEQLEATKTAIIHAGAIGDIQKSKNPEAAADKWIRKYPDYISGAEAKQLAGNARQQIRANNYDTEFARRRDKEIATDKSNAAVDDYLVTVRSQDPKLANDPTAKKILNDPTLLPAAKNNLLNYIDRQIKPETQTMLSQQTFVGLLRDLRNPDADTDQVMQKAWDARLQDPGKPGSMSEKDFNAFRAEVVARKTPEGAALETDRSAFFKNYANTIAGPAANYTPQLGDPKVYAAEMDARRVEADLKKKGLDPHLAYDPSSPYFLGKPDRIQKWQQSMQQDLQTRTTLPGNGLPAQKDITGTQTGPKPPEKGFVKDGYEFLGGSPGAASSWRKVEDKT